MKITSSSPLLKIVQISFIVLALSVMTVLFATFYLTESPWDTPAFENISEMLVTRKISATLTFFEDFRQKGGFLYAEEGKLSTKLPGLYTSQVGLQGLILHGVRQILAADTYKFLGFARISFSLLLSITLTIVVYSAWMEFGPTTSIFFLFLVLSSFWIVAFSKNLYWAEFTMLLPFAAGWSLYPKVIRRRLPLFGYLFITTGLLLLKSLNGYEYITNIILGASIGPLYYELGASSKIKDLIKNITFILLAGITGFLFAYFIHFLQLFAYTQDIQKAFFLLTERAITRTIGENPYKTACDFSNYFIVILKYLDTQSIFRTDIPLVWMFGAYSISIVPIIPFRFTKVISISIISVSLAIIAMSFGIDYYLGRPGFGITQIVLFLAGLTVFSYGLLSFFKIKPINSKKMVGLAIATTWALLSSFTWVLLAKNHMACHIHINPIIFYLPFGVTLFLYLGYWLEFLLHNPSTN